ncbi:Retrovirus-related Pol polyprotein from transposon 17.6 [Vitis vinifera]|uniref:Retrovirus-related Pol polyprotein from transposon 17.6 n=1 Tax=Vitis vinifera TaxID=29760 RepID=A0A438HBS9_VITVI|nr:Retrovirus-related Pol polyprotein from transposon 17.6 [Vitis vinifera]
MPREVHMTLHYGRRHEKGPKLSRETRSLLYIGLYIEWCRTFQNIHELARLRSGHKGSMSGSNVEETSEQTRGKELEHTARGRAGRINLCGVKEEGLGLHGMEARDQKIRQELAIYKIAVSARVMATHEAPRVEVPKPQTFSGKRDAKELDNFLWHMELYLEAIALTDEATKREIKRQFYPEDVAYLARKSMKRLKHTGSIREYIKEFSTLMLEIPNMSKEELLFNFMDNLQNWAEQELRRCGVQDLATTMAVGETRDHKAILLRKDQAKTLVARETKARISGRSHARTNCFLCDGHMGTRLLKRKALNAMIEKRRTRAMLRPPRPWWTLVPLTTLSQRWSKETRAPSIKEGGWLKAVNSTVKPLHGVARGVKAVSLPFLCSMAILEEEKPCMVPTVTEGTPKTPMLSALQVKKGLKRKEVTYLATLKEERDDGSGEPMPKEMRRGFIQPSKAPYGAPVLFQKKYDGSLRMCIYYRALNKVMVKNKYSIPLIADLFDQLGMTRYFTKLDLRSRYYQVRIAEEDEPKTTCVTRYDSYEFLVMPFGLTNAQQRSIALINKIFHPYLDKFVVVYLDDIVIDSNTLKEHVEHLKKVFKILRQNELYVKKEKCSFAKEEVNFLGHRIKDGKLMMDDRNKNHQPRVTPLIDLLKKNNAWEWDKKCHRAFKDLKKAVTEEPVLALPDHTKVFEVHTNALDFAIGGVLMQERHLIAFESRKLNDTERRYTVQENANHLVDALSRKTELTFMTSQAQRDIMDLLREGLQHDLMAKSFIVLAHEGKTKRFGWMTTYSTLRGDDSMCLSGKHKAKSEQGVS